MSSKKWKKFFILIHTDIPSKILERVRPARIGKIRKVALPFPSSQFLPADGSSFQEALSNGNPWQIRSNLHLMQCIEYILYIMNNIQALIKAPVRPYKALLYGGAIVIFLGSEKALVASPGPP